MPKPVIEVALTTPSVRYEDLSVLVNQSTVSVLNRVQAAVEPTESHRYKTVVSVEQLD